MRNLRDTFMRLFILAQHLETGNMRESYEKLHFFYSDDKQILLIGRGGRYHMVIPQIVFELPYLFSEFKRTATGEVYYIPAPEIGINYAVMEYFGLTINEYLHLACIDRFHEEFGGERITLDYTTKQIAQNMYVFLERTIESHKSNKIKQV